MLSPRTGAVLFYMLWPGRALCRVWSPALDLTRHHPRERWGSCSCKWESAMHWFLMRFPLPLSWAAHSSGHSFFILFPIKCWRFWRTAHNDNEGVKCEVRSKADLSFHRGLVALWNISWPTEILWHKFGIIWTLAKKNQLLNQHPSSDSSGKV